MISSIFSLLLGVLLLFTPTTVFSLEFTFNDITHDKFSELEGWSSTIASSTDLPNHFFALCEKHQNIKQHHQVSVEDSRKSQHNIHHFIPLHDDHRHSHFAKVLFVRNNSSDIDQQQLTKHCIFKEMTARDKIAPVILSPEQNEDDAAVRKSTTFIHVFLSTTTKTNDEYSTVFKQLCSPSSPSSSSPSFVCHKKSQSSHIITIEIVSPMPRLSSLALRFASHPFVRRIDLAHHPHFLNNIASITTQATVPVNGMASLGDKSHLHPLWQHNITGIGHIAAVADTGVDYDHCSFDDPNEKVAFWPEVNPRHRKIYSYRECVTKSHKLSHGDSFQAHGTHVAATVAGSEFPRQTSIDNTLDASQGNRALTYRGMAPDAKLFFFDLTCGKDQALSIPHDPYDVFLPAHEAGADIQSNSWGFPWSPRHYEAADRQTDKFAFDHPSFLIFFAAGNSPAKGVLTPATAKNVLTIGAHQNSLDKNLRTLMASFSAHGPSYDFRIKPELAGPGQEITSAASDGNLASHNCQFIGKSGTSMATPVVSGSAVLVKQYFEEGFYPDGRRKSGNEQKKMKISGVALKAAMVTASYPLNKQRASVPNWNEGYGGLNLGELLRFDDTTTTTNTGTNHLLLLDQVKIESSNNNNINNEDPYRKFCISMPVDNPLAFSFRDFLRITMVYHDPPMVAEGAKSAMLNDLDLIVTNPFSGDTFISESALKSAYMHSNTEQVVISKKPSSSSKEQFYFMDRFFFNIAIRGKHLATEYQNFSIVAMGLGIQLENEEDGCTSEFLKTKKQKSGAGSSSTTKPSSSDMIPTLKCPFDCGSENGFGKSRGECDVATGFCKCNPFFKGIWCEECNSDTLCHGKGFCKKSGNSTPPTCDCSTTSVDLEASKKESEKETDVAKRSYCSVCKAGWTGSRCHFKTSCEDASDCFGHGKCRPLTERDDANNNNNNNNNKATTCSCDQMNGEDVWNQYSNCRLCTFDRSQNVSAASSCEVKTHWCLNRQTRLISFETLLQPEYIQINDYSSYQNSMTCTWRFEVNTDKLRKENGPKDNFIFRLTFIKFDIELTFDTVSVFDIGAGRIRPNNQEKKNLRDFSHVSSTSGVLPTDEPILFATGNDRPPQKTTESDVLVVEFDSDFLGPGFGFLAKIEALRKCDQSTCHGNGVCLPKSGSCSCNAKNFDDKKDCAVCKSGWKGKQCDERDGDAPTPTPSPSVTPSPSNSNNNHKNKFVSECYTSEGSECSDHGVCDVEGTGRCKCNGDYRGFLCDKPCPRHNGVLCGGLKGSCEYDEGKDIAICKCQKGFTGESCQLKTESVLEFDPINSLSGGVFVQENVLANGKETTGSVEDTSIVKVKWPLGSGGDRIFVTIHATPSASRDADLPVLSPTAGISTGDDNDDAKSSSSNNKNGRNSAFLTKIWNDWSSIGILTASASSAGEPSVDESGFNSYKSAEADDEFLSISASPKCFVLNVFDFSPSSSKSRSNNFIEFGLTFFSQHQKLDLVISMTASYIGPSLIPLMDVENGRDDDFSKYRRNKNRKNLKSFETSSRSTDYNDLLRKLSGNTQKKKTASSTLSSRQTHHYITVSSTSTCEDELIIPIQLSSTSADDAIESLPLSNLAVIISVGVVTFVLGAVLAAVAFFLWKHSIKKSRIRRRGTRLATSSSNGNAEDGAAREVIVGSDESNHNNTAQNTSAVDEDDDDTVELM